MARILVIDDSRLACLAMRRSLEKANHEVLTADRAEAGLELLEKEPVDCVTVDVLMPGMGGVEFLEAVRARGIDVPVIVATADIQKTTREECHARGAWGVISKPVDGDELLSLIASATSSAGRWEPLLTPEHQDALTELVNMGVGRAAGALNDLIEGHVDLQVPHIDLVDLKHLDEAITGLGRDPVSSVQMGFRGGMEGYAFLVFPPSSALELVQIVIGEEAGTADLDTMHAATLTEIGNIVISAVMGTVGNVLQRPLDYSLPVYELEPVVDLLAMRQEGNPLILIAKTSFTIRRAVTIEGHLLLLFELSSLDSLIASLLDLEG